MDNEYTALTHNRIYVEEPEYSWERSDYRSPVSMLVGLDSDIIIIYWRMEKRHFKFIFSCYYSNCKLQRLTKQIMQNWTTIMKLKVPVNHLIMLTVF